jgi:hypothetical protein
MLSFRHAIILQQDPVADASGSLPLDEYNVAIGVPRWRFGLTNADADNLVMESVHAHA